MSKRFKIAGLVLICLVFATFAWFTTIGGTAYLYALHLEGKWDKANPKTKRELEQYLHCYSLRQIDPKHSMWGNGYHLLDGERMMQYCILWHKRCPLDVVYDQNDNIIRIFTSYE